MMTTEGAGHFAWRQVETPTSRDYDIHSLCTRYGIRVSRVGNAAGSATQQGRQRSNTSATQQQRVVVRGKVNQPPPVIGATANSFRDPPRYRSGGDQPRCRWQSPSATARGGGALIVRVRTGARPGRDAQGERNVRCVGVVAGSGSDTPGTAASVSAGCEFAGVLACWPLASSIGSERAVSAEQRASAEQQSAPVTSDRTSRTIHTLPQSPGSLCAWRVALTLVPLWPERFGN